MSANQLKQITDEAKALAREARAVHQARVEEARRSIAGLVQLQAMIGSQIRDARAVLERAGQEQADLEAQLGASG